MDNYYAKSKQVFECAEMALLSESKDIKANISPLTQQIVLRQ